MIGRSIDKLLVGVCCWLVLGSAAAYTPEHTSWNQLLAAHVQWNSQGTATTVDYSGFLRERKALNTYLDELAAVEQAQFDRWPLAERQAFLINAYNACTVELILTAWPEVESIKDLGSFWTSPWQQPVCKLLGATRTLDEIEHTLLRGAPGFKEPRVHFAVNCASIGCPALRPEAYVGTQLDTQLEDQTVRFLRDRSRNSYDGSAEELQVSKIFDWYADDFALGWRDATSLGQFLALFGEALELSPALLERLRAGELDIGYQKYDWSLNRR